ncbi:MAG TPA: PD-(D/E)XK nuclease family protein [Candidatus Obscuribacterales bacterium]
MSTPELIFKPGIHQYYQGGREIPGVTKILNHFGIVDLSFVHEDILRTCRDRGTNVHLLYALYDQGDLGEYDPAWNPWLNAWKKFLNDFKPEIIAVEIPLSSRLWNLAGTIDRIIRTKEGGVIDIKTGVPQKATALQTAAYKILVEENFPNIKIKFRWTLKVEPDNYRIIEHKDRTDEHVFKGLVQAYNWKLNKGLIKGDRDDCSN